VKADGHPSFRELSDWVDGRLDTAAASRIEQACGDPATTATLRWLNGFRRLAAAIPVESPPAIVRQNLRRAFARRFDPQPAVAIIELAARLVFDSRRHLQPAGVRAVTAAGRSVHLAFAASGLDMVVDVHRRADGDLLDLDVQIYVDEERPQAPVFEAVARGSDWVTRTSEGDVLGRVRLQRIRPEEIGLRVTNGEIALTASLDLRHIAP
jgi:hypothetical protein